MSCWADYCLAIVSTTSTRQTLDRTLQFVMNCDQSLHTRLLHVHELTAR
jgi:hypothetical protein